MPKSRVRKKSRRQRSAPRVPSAVATLTFPELVFPSDLLGLSAPEQTDIQVDVVFRQGDSDGDYRLPLRLLRRIVSDSRIELWGTALQGALAVHLYGTPDNRWQMQTRVSGAEIDGMQMLKILQMFDAVADATGVGLARSTAAPEVWSEIAAEGFVAAPTGLRAVVEAHAQIERRLEVSVAVPVSYTPAEVQDTLETAALLRGELVSQTWSERRWDVSDLEANELLSGAFAEGSSALMELEEEWFWSVGKRQIQVGTVAVTYRSIRIAKTMSPNRTSKSAAITTLVLEPGTDDHVLFRLVEVHSDRPLTGDQRYFWEPSWQGREDEVDRFLELGQVAVHDDVAAFLDHLDAVTAEGKGD